MSTDINNNLIYTSSKSSGALYITTIANRATMGEVVVGTSTLAFHAVGTSKRQTGDSRDPVLGELLVLKEALPRLLEQVEDEINRRLAKTEE